jgi:hypothetical protein
MLVGPLVQQPCSNAESSNRALTLSFVRFVDHLLTLQAAMIPDLEDCGANAADAEHYSTLTVYYASRLLRLSSCLYHYDSVAFQATIPRPKLCRPVPRVIPPLRVSPPSTAFEDV